MNTKLIVSLALAAAAGIASAQVGVDGVKGAEWTGYSPTAHVTHQAGTDEGNFSTPTQYNLGADYDIYLRSDSTYLYGLITVTGNAGLSAGDFANLYFDLNPSANDGSDWGMEIGNNRAFIPGVAGFFNLTGNLTYATVSGGVEFALKWSYLENAANPDVTYYGAGPIAPGDKVTLRLSQAFGYSVAGGATYGDDRLGSVNAPPSAPAPAAMAAFGLGLVGRIRRRRSTK